MEEIIKNTKSNALVGSLKIAIFTLIFMTIYEWVKQIIIPNISIWESHIVTIAVATILASMSGYFFLKKEEKLNIKIKYSLNFYQQLLDKIPIPIFYKNKKCVYIGCNISF